MPCHFVLLFDSTTQSDVPAALRTLYISLHKQIGALHVEEYFSLQILSSIVQKEFIQDRNPFISKLHEFYTPSQQHQDNPPSISQVTAAAFRSMYEFLDETMGTEGTASVFVLLDSTFANAPLSHELTSMLPTTHSKIFIICPVEGVQLDTWAQFSMLHNASCHNLHSKERISHFVDATFSPYNPAYIAYGHMLQRVALHRDPTLLHVKHILPKVLSIQAFIDTKYVHAAKCVAKFTILPIEDSPHTPSSSANLASHHMSSSAAIVDSYSTATNPWTRTDPSMNFLQLLAKIILEKNVAPVLTLNTESYVALILPVFKKAKYDLTLQCVHTSSLLTKSSQSPTPWLIGNIHTMLNESIARGFAFSAEERAQSLYKCPPRNDSLNVLAQDTNSVRQCFDKIQRLLHGGADRWHICVKECERVRLTSALYKNQSLLLQLVSLLEKENKVMQSERVSQMVEHLRTKAHERLVGSSG